jgi:hypothetical protein
MFGLATGINPDQGIRVAVVSPDGMVAVYEPLRKNQSVRSLAYRRAFSNYGKGRLWASEFEADNRRMKAKETE